MGRMTRSDPPKGAQAERRPTNNKATSKPCGFSFQRRTMASIVGSSDSDPERKMRWLTIRPGWSRTVR